MLLKDVPFESNEIKQRLSAIDSSIRLTKMEIDIANDKIKNATSKISTLQKEVVEQKINYLKKKGWTEFVFSAKDKQDQKLHSFLEVTFLFKKGIFKKEFRKMSFECNFGKGFTAHFSGAGLSLKNEAFLEFERWIKSLTDDDYIIIKDIWY